MTVLRRFLPFLLLSLAHGFLPKPIATPVSFFPSFRSSELGVGNFLAGVAGIPPSSLLDTADSDSDGLCRSLVLSTSLQDKPLECCYKASRDGWSAIDFHEAVDERGSGLVVCLNRRGQLFGGFNPLGWRSSDDYGSTNAAFCWFVDARNLEKAIKCPVLQGGNAAIFDYATGGPNFGPADLVIGSPKAAVLGGFAGPDMEDTSINAGNLKEGSSTLGGAYNFVRGWPVGGKFQLAEVEVYCNAEIQKPKSGGGGGGSWWPF